MTKVYIDLAERCSMPLAPKSHQLMHLVHRTPGIDISIFTLDQSNFGRAVGTSKCFKVALISATVNFLQYGYTKFN